jgi:hypothetical protein
MSVWIGKAVWSRETERGHIADVTFQNITSVAPTRADPPADADLVGFDADHLVEDVQFRNVVVGGKPLAADRVRQNAFVRGVVITP